MQVAERRVGLGSRDTFFLCGLFCVVFVAEIVLYATPALLPRFDNDGRSSVVVVADYCCLASAMPTASCDSSGVAANLAT